MNPPPSYHDILQKLNSTVKNEMLLIEEVKELKNELELLKIENELNKDAKNLFHSAYIKAKKNEITLTVSTKHRSKL
jgi:hypothetical protein